MAANVTNAIIGALFQQLKDVRNMGDNLQLLNTELARMDDSLRHIQTQFEDQQRQLPEMVEGSLGRMKDALEEVKALIDRANRQRGRCCGCCLFFSPNIPADIREWKTRFNELFRQLVSDLSNAAHTAHIVVSAQPQLPSAFEPNASPIAADDKFPGGDSPQASNAAPLVYHHDEQVGLPIDAPSLPSTCEPCPPPAPVAHHHDEQVGLPIDDPSLPSTFEPNASPPAPVAHHHDEQVILPIDAPSLPSTSELCPPPAPVAHHDEQVRLPIDAPSVPSTCQATAPPTAADDKVLEGVSPQASAAGNLDEQVGLPSASSSSETVRNISNAIREEAEKSDLHAIIQRISELFDAIKIQKESQKKTKRSKESQKKIDRPTSAGFLKLKDFLLEAVNSICSLKDVLPAHEATKVARDVI